MNRRDVLKLLGMVVPAVIFTGLPESEVIETIAAHEGLSLSDTELIAAEFEKIRDVIPTLFERDDVFFAAISKGDVQVVSKRDMRVPLQLRPGFKF